MSSLYRRWYCGIGLDFGRITLKFVGYESSILRTETWWYFRGNTRVEGWRNTIWCNSIFSDSEPRIHRPYLSRVIPHVLHSHEVACVHLRLYHDAVVIHDSLWLLLLLLLVYGLHDRPYHVLLLLEPLRLYLLLHHRLNHGYRVPRCYKPVLALALACPMSLTDKGATVRLQ